MPRARRDLRRAALCDGAPRPIKETGEIKEKDIFMGDFPLMTEERHVHHQRRRARRGQPARALAGRLLHRRGGSRPRGRQLFAAKLIPNRGAWLEFETSNRDLLSVKIDRKRKIPVTTLLRAMAPSATAIPARPSTPDLRPTRASSTPSRMSTTAPTTASSRPRWTRTRVKTPEEALLEVYRKLRPGDPPTLDNAQHADLQPVLSLPPLRPGQRGPLQAEPQAGPGRSRRRSAR